MAVGVRKSHRKRVEATLSRAEVLKLARLGTSAGLQYRIKQGFMPPADPKTGRFNKVAVEAAIAKYKPGAPGRKATATARPGRGRTEGESTLERAKGENRDPNEFFGLDPDTHYRLAKALQEELKLRKMREELLDARTTELRVASFIGLIKSTIEAFPAKESPGIAARVELIEGRVSEASMYREVRAAVQKTLLQISGMDLKAALQKGLDEVDEAQEVEAFETAAKQFEKKKKKVKA